MSEWVTTQTLINFGSTWNIHGSGKTYVNDITTHTQTVTLQDTNSAKFWFPGNGIDSYLVLSAVITQGALSTPLKVNGATAFYVPKDGRWSDFASIANFNLPGEVTFSFSIASTSAKIPTAPAAPTTPVGVSAYSMPINIASGEFEVEEDRLVFDLQFENGYKILHGIEPTLRLPDRVLLT